MVKISSYFAHHKSDGMKFVEPSMTQQQFKDESDINNIVDHNMRYKDPAFITKLTLAGKVSQAQPIYGDFSAVKDYQQSIEIIRLAQEQFSCLDAKVRDRFNNDPAQMLAFCEDPNNYDEGVKLGLYQPKVVEVQTSQEAGSNTDIEPNSTSIGETSAQ